MIRKFFGRFRMVAVSAAAVAVIGYSSVAGAEALRTGDYGEEVAEIQAKLVDAGYDVAVDGDFGPATCEAVKSFQEANGLDVDGLIGPTTYGALMGRSMPPISRGSNYMSRRVMSTALSYLGTPYVFGGSSPSGFDCSGYVQYVFANAGISLPRTADVQFDVGTPVDKSDLQPGDMVFFSTYEPGPSHVGIYIGDGNFIHASSTGCVKITPLNKQYYIDAYLGARRVL